MTISFSEAFVRLYWKDPQTHFKDGDSHSADIWSVDLGAKHIWNTDHKNMWDEAAEFTRMRLRMIEDTEEQYYWLLHCTDYSALTPVQEHARKSLINDINLKLQALKTELSI